MQEQLYEFAVIRVVPKVEREEFINAGIILFCKRKKFLKAVCLLSESKLRAFCHETDSAQVIANLSSLERIASGSKDSGQIGQMETAERFRWLTAIRSTVIQTSRPHPGFTSDPEATLQRLLSELVL
ncbi:DUF3037 domain-containing protein [Flavobacterium selenitireducens]|uniref:DUF3037 domain-containing protein n=1 Tax=Flavobacterium selenitireducens TaxID=2722704 RepID=UPI00168B3329|nr:DUF3037 domain-containing protein [Flavobacterium selenitireducens]MBD3581356.1 DUF3037 domain-containing protein [Flavobacterium selenitireducens]